VSFLSTANWQPGLNEVHDGEEVMRAQVLGKDTRKCRILASITAPPAEAALPIFSLFPLTATMIRIHIQFRFQLKVFIVAGSDLLCETWQLLFKRFMPENGRLS